MRGYVVTGEFINAKVTTATGSTIVGFYKRAVLPDNVDEAHLRRLVDKGLVEEQELDEPEGAEPLDPDDLADGLSALPARSASKADWVAYATDEARGEQRLTAEEADGLTRDQLAAAYHS